MIAMMRTSLVLIFLCITLLPEALLALQPCPSLDQCPANAGCTAAGQPCVCNPGFHENSIGDACEADKAPGSTCTQKDSDRECVEGASCVNVAGEGEAEVLQCTCKEGYQQRARVGASPTCKRAPGSNCTVENSTEECVPDSTCRASSVEGQVQVQLTCTCNEGKHMIESNGLVLCKEDLQPGENCTMAGEATECVDNALCTASEEGTVCTCTAKYHSVTDPTTNVASCQPDIAPNGPCQTKDSEECVENAVCQNTAPEGQPEVLTCVCPDTMGFHVVSMQGTPFSCEADVPPGGNCSMEDDVTECVDHATCVNMTSEGTLQCACNAGYHVMTGNTSEADSCQPDVIVGGQCTMNGSDAECVEGATCLLSMTSGENVTDLVCTCMDGYHPMVSDPTTCEEDKAAGSPCSMKNGNECLQNAECQNTAPEGQPESLQCVCLTGYHVKDNHTCEENVEAGMACSEEGSTEECMDNATCTNTQSGGDNITSLTCMCDPGYHVTQDAANRTVCAEDTCQHTREKCAAAGMTTCEEVNAFVSCMLSGKCDADDSEQLEQFRAAMMESRDHMTADCAYEVNATTCTENVTGCLNVYLKSNSTCNSTDMLGSCLTDHQSECQENAGQKLATKFMEQDYQQLSCVCEKASIQCLERQTINFNNAMDNTTKCNAVKELFSCALDDVACDVSKPTDHQILSGLWSIALVWSSDTGCKDSLQNADTCPLRLTSCALEFSDGTAVAGANKTMQCRSAKTFGDCIKDNSTLCNENDTVTTLFREQYSLVSADCLCVTKVTECEDAVGVLTQDSLEDCPKLEKLNLCLLSAHCNLADNDDMASLDSAGDWYTHHRANNSCVMGMASNSTCWEDIAMCADNLTNHLQGDIQATQKCSAVSDSMLCIHAANCSSDVTEDMELVTSSLEAARYRLRSLACKEPTCNVTLESLAECKTTYEGSFIAAGTDNGLKCTAKNDMVRCLRRFRCNSHMTDVIDFKYEALRKVNVPNCELLSLDADDSTGTATSLHTSLLVLLAGLLVSLTAAARM